MAEEKTHSAFPLAGRKEFGYRPEQVDDFLEQARASYDGSAPEGETLTASDLRGASFDMRRGGYSPRYVDAALERLEDVFFERERRADVRDGDDEARWVETRELLSEVRARLARPHGQRFKRRGFLATGYRRSQVDAFLDSIQDSFAKRQLTHTAAEVREVMFHSERRGYDEAQVDALLDAVVELVLATR